MDGMTGIPDAWQSRPRRTEVEAVADAHLLIAVAVAYVAVLLLAPLAGIVWTAIQGGLACSSTRSRSRTCGTRIS